MRSDQQLYNEMSVAGFTLLRKKRHQVWACPCGKHLITCHSTPVGGRGGANAMAVLRRTVRACAQERKAAA